MNAIVFDIGNVLVRWDPVLPFLPTLGTRERVAEFLARTSFHERNLRADGGIPWADLAAEITDPDDRALFATYITNFAASVAEPIEQTWILMERLRARGHSIHAITNWSAESWPLGVAAHPRLATAFGVTVVSGLDRVRKPNAAIFNLLCTRAGVAPGDCVFIDDTMANVSGAQAAGMDAIHFTDPAALETALSHRRLL